MARTRSGHPLPSISYQQAMRLKLPDETGRLVRVFDCHASLFRQAVYAAAETHEACNEIKEQLRGLLFRYRPDKWYAITVLAKYGVAFPGKPPEAVDGQVDEEAMLKALWVQPAD